jgi:hypothetical protein
MLSNREMNGTTIYLNVVGGKFARKVNKDTEGAQKRINKAGNEVYELLYNTLTGQLTSLDIYEGDYGKQYNFTIKDVDEYCVLSLPAESKICKMLLYRLPNINKTNEVTLKVGQFDDGGTWLSADQGGTKVPYYYTKDDNKGLPQPIHKKVGKKDVWDWTDHEEFLEKMAIEWFGDAEEAKEALKGNRETGVRQDELAEHVIGKKEARQKDFFNDSDDKLPF